MAIGKYPDISLKEARAERELLRKSLREGQDPALKNQAEEDMEKTHHLFFKWLRSGGKLKQRDGHLNMLEQFGTL